MFTSYSEKILVRNVSIESEVNKYLAENIVGESQPLHITPERLSHAIAGMVQELMAGGRGMLADNLRGEKSVDGAEFSAQNAHASNSIGRYLGTGNIESGDLRRTLRYPVRLPSRIYTRERTAEATVVDVSRDGLGIEIGQALEVGERVAVENGSCIVLARVRYCRETREGYLRAGLEVYHVVVCNPEGEEAKP